MRSIVTIALHMLIASTAFAHDSAEHSAPTTNAPLRAAFDATLAAADRAIQRYGVTDSAMIQIQTALAQLATQPSLRDRADLKQIHGSTSSNLEAKNKCSTGWSAGCNSHLALCSSHHWMRRKNRCGVHVRITVGVGSK